MSRRFLAQLEGVLRAVRVRADASLTWFGRPIRPLGSTDDARRVAASRLLADRLYHDFYTAGGVVPERRDLSTDALASRPLWPQGTGRHELGYRWYGDPGALDGTRLDRLYLHVTPPGARALPEAVLAGAERAGLTATLKVLDDEAAYDRCDSAVLYVPRAARQEALGLARRIALGLEASMRRQVPALTLPIAPGVGFAEDPGGAASFGGDRCARLAEALIALKPDGSRPPPSLLGELADGLASRGVSAGAPYLVRHE